MALNKTNTFVTTIAAGIAALSSVFAPAALAQQQTETTNAQQLQQEPWIQAARWARSNPQSVAMFISIGSQESLSPSDFKNMVERAIEQNYDFDVEVWTEVSDSPGTVAQFFYDDVATEPFPFHQAGEEIKKVAAQRRALIDHGIINAPD